MFRKVIVLLACITVAIGTAWSAEISDLEEGIRLTRALLNESADSALCHFVVEKMITLCDRAPASPFAPEALSLSAELSEKFGHHKLATDLAARVFENYPASAFALPSFDFAWKLLTDDGLNPEAGAELCLSMATSLKTDPAAIDYYRRAMDTYQQANLWDKAAEVGIKYFDQCAGANPDAVLLLALSDAALKKGDSPLAVRGLTRFISQYPNLPQVVTARYQIGQIAVAEGNTQLANEHFSRAWSLYQKNRRKGEYNQPAIARAAADALWTLQIEPKRQYESRTAPDLPLTKGQRSQADELHEAFTQVMITDHEFAPRCFSAIGDVHTHLADALLGQGFRNVVARSGGSAQPPYSDAMPEYNKAVAAYLQAWERGALEPHNPDAATAARYAAERAFEVQVGQGDAVMGWAFELMAQAPREAPGAGGANERFSYLTTTVTPLIVEGLNYKTEALKLTERMPVAALAEPVRDGLDLPVRAVTNELSRLCANENKTVLSQSAQLASSASMGYSAVSGGDIAASLKTNFDRATEYGKEYNRVLDKFYASMVQSRVPETCQVYWDSLLIAEYTNYTETCRSLQTNLAVCLANLPAQGDDRVNTLRKQLSRLQADGASEEYAGLVRWHKWAYSNGVDHRLNDPLAARLAELDPVHYSSPDDLPSASRRKP